MVFFNAHFTRAAFFLQRKVNTKLSDRCKISLLMNRAPGELKSVGYFFFIHEYIHIVNTFFIIVKFHYVAVAAKIIA